jgi:hypothetical protein
MVASEINNKGENLIDGGRPPPSCSPIARHTPTPMINRRVITYGELDLCHFRTCAPVNLAKNPKCGGIGVAKGIREYHGARNVKALPFAIHPLAQFSERLRRGKSTRDIYQFKNSSNPRVKPIYRTLLPALQRASVHSQAATDHNADNITPKHLAVSFIGQRGVVPDARQLIYGDYKISATLQERGKWVAHFGRSDGRLIGNVENRRAVLETPTFDAEIMAIAAAQIEIDGFVRQDQTAGIVKAR